MFELAKMAGYLLSPFTLALGLGLVAWLLLALRRRRWALWLGLASFAGLWVASLPVVALSLISELESQYPAVAAQASPNADAILVLGGALSGASPPKRPTFGIGPSAGRVWHAASLFRAGKAKWVVIAGGNQPGFEGDQSEADAIAEMLQVLGVPESAIRREGTSRNTIENAANVRASMDGLKVRKILLVTSALHMPRAVKTFLKVWKGSTIEIVPAPTDVQLTDPRNSLKVWLPSLDALVGVTKALKEFAGMLALGII